MLTDFSSVCVLGALKEENTGVGMRWYLSNANITTRGSQMQKVNINQMEQKIVTWGSFFFQAIILRNPLAQVFYPIELTRDRCL